MVLNKMLFTLFFIAYAAENTNPCLIEFEKIIVNAKQSFSLTPNDYGKMFIYSGKNINQLGRFEACYDISIAKYTIIEFSKFPVLLLSICGPNVCTESDYIEIINSVINTTANAFNYSSLIPVYPGSTNKLNLNYSVIFPEHEIHTRFNDVDKGAIAMIVIMVLIGLVCIVGTAADVLIKQDEEVIRLDVEQTGLTKDDYYSVPGSENHIVNVLICFSLIRNMKKLVSVHLDEYHPHLYFFDGIRVVTMCWVILGTVGSYYLYYLPTANYMKLSDIFQKYYILPVYTSLYALDVLFWVGGFLYAYFLLNSFSASPRHWLLLHLKHYLEMMPLFMFVTFFFWTLSRYIGNGPFWYTGNDIYSDCKDYWYVNGLFLSNFIPNGT